MEQQKEKQRLQRLAQLESENSTIIPEYEMPHSSVDKSKYGLEEDTIALKWRIGKVRGNKIRKLLSVRKTAVQTIFDSKLQVSQVSCCDRVHPH